MLQIKFLAEWKYERNAGNVISGHGHGSNRPQVNWIHGRNQPQVNWIHVRNRPQENIPMQHFNNVQELCDVVTTDFN